METALTLDRDLPEEERAEAEREQAYRRFLARLSQQSVVKHFDAYADVPWDDPAFALDPEDARHVLGADDPLGATAWYRAQPLAVQARIGLHMIATFARIGWTFESILKRGLLEFADTLPDNAPEFRYLYHELIEEAQHSLMFHELVMRSGLEVPPPRVLGFAQHRVIRFARTFPELFFMLVLSGEDPIDWVQRHELQSGRELHPLIERISRIHVTEEARHISFARQYLRRAVPKLSGRRLLRLRFRTPIVLKFAADVMMRPSEHVVKTYGIPAAVLGEGYGPGSLHRARVVRALHKPRELCWEIGILNDRWAPLWRRLGIWAPRSV